MRRNFHRGFTLVELLVVIAIIGTLVAILLPAVQGARESARKAACSNNMHNLALAAQQYHTNMGSYPSGWICLTGAAPASPVSGDAVPYFEGWGWGALLLPYLEQKNLHTYLAITGNAQMNQGGTPVSLGNRARLDLRLADCSQDPTLLENITVPALKIFMCPSDTGFNGRGQVDSFRAFDSGEGTTASGAAPILAGVSNFVGVAGHRFVSGTIRNTGIFYGNSYVRDADILDGLSNTAMFGERETQICHSGTWLGVLNPAGVPTLPQGSENSAGFAMVAGYSYPRLNIASPSAAATNIDLARITTSFDGCGSGFSSNHPGGAHFTFADGGVRFIVNGVQWNYQATANPAGPLDHKLQNNGIYQRIMSINDKLPSNL